MWAYHLPGVQVWYNVMLMVGTTLASSAPSRGGITLFGPQSQRRTDLLALLALLCATLAGLVVGYTQASPFAVSLAGTQSLYLQSFHEPETVAGQTVPSYRWTQEQSAIDVPGL